MLLCPSTQVGFVLCLKKIHYKHIEKSSKVVIRCIGPQFTHQGAERVPAAHSASAEFNPRAQTCGGGGVRSPSSLHDREFFVQLLSIGKESICLK